MFGNHSQACKREGVTFKNSVYFPPLFQALLVFLYKSWKRVKVCECRKRKSPFSCFHPLLMERKVIPHGKYS